VHLDLRILQRDLGGESDGEAHDDLEADLFACACRLVHGVKQTTADGTERAADEPEQRHDADLCEREALRDGRKGERDDQGQHADAGADRVGIMDGLEVEREVVEDDEVGAREEDHEESAGPDVSLCELRCLVSVCCVTRRGQDLRCEARSWRTPSGTVAMRRRQTGGERSRQRGR
jgi:hypothetical protein